MQQLSISNTQVYIGNDVMQELRNYLSTRKRVFVLVDVNTLKKCLPLLEKFLPDHVELHTLVIQDGEQNKNIQTVILLWKQLMQLNVSREDVLINLGGGVVCDMGAFVASTFKRGINFINIPTTLLSMVDAAIGGKTGVDLEGVKNQIGTFASPQYVFVYPPFLKTLEKRQLKNGFAEIIKHSVICQSNLWKDLQSISFSDIPPEQLIVDAVKAKVQIVTKDPTEAGFRKILNFGHTIGHAMESLSMAHDRYNLLHGEAVAAGMICEAWLSNQKTGLSQRELRYICDLLLKHFPKYVIPVSGYDKLLEYIRKDKKNVSDKFQFSLLKSIGECKYNVSCSEDDIIESLNFYSGLELKNE